MLLLQKNNKKHAKMKIGYQRKTTKIKTSK